MLTDSITDTPGVSIPLSRTALKAVADLLGGGAVIAYRPDFAHAFGGAANAVMLSQFWFWTNTPTVKAREGGWFWKSQKELTQESGLSRSEILTARRDLMVMGVLEENLRGVPATVHYRVNKDTLYSHLWKYIQKRANQIAENKQSSSRETRKQACRKQANYSRDFFRNDTEKTTESCARRRVGCSKN